MGRKILDLDFKCSKCWTPGNAFCNVKACFADTSCFEEYPGFVNGFLVLTQNQKLNYLEINMLARRILQKMMEDFPKNTWKVSSFVV